MVELYECGEIVTRLVRRFPPAGNIHLRMALYERLGRLCEDSEVGGKVYRLIASVVADSMGKRDPGRYFARSVMLRLKESSLLPSQEI